jgi:hypothetical protein
MFMNHFAGASRGGGGDCEGWRNKQLQDKEASFADCMIAPLQNQRSTMNNN